ncbi:MAG: DUF1573 domain-containing protein [Pirellulales bacterium]
MCRVKSFLAAIALSTLLAAPAAGQEWARKMFEATNHDFESVARGSKVQHRFVFTNLYKEDVHITSVRSSCGCTTAEFTDRPLKTYEKGEVIATLNTRSYSGQRSATLTVTFDQPFYAEVQLLVTGFVRTDVVLDPPGIEFGTVDAQSAATRTLGLSYAGRSDWKITGIKPTSPYLSAKIVEKNRSAGTVNYEVSVELQPDAPAGYIHEQIFLTTSERTELPVEVEGQVVGALTVSPASLFLGVVDPGNSVTRQVIVRSKRPFKVLNVTSDADGFDFKVSDQAKLLHVIPVTFVAGDKPGKLTASIRIETDLDGGATVDCKAFGQIARPAGANAAAKLPVSRGSEQTIN